tara:strand:- start:455 stop:2053 length:1599 start_codon:yes stop_codon:yes gene_type:complete
MGITKLKQPNSPNLSGADLIYTISSSNADQFQFRYIYDVHDYDTNDKLATFKYPANQYGTCNANLGRVIGDYLDNDYNWKATAVISSSNNFKDFYIRYGEEYSTSYTAPVTQFLNISSSVQLALKGSIPNSPQNPSILRYEPSTNQRTTPPAFNVREAINWFYEPYVNDNPGIPFDSFNTYQYGDQILTNNPNLLNGASTSKYWNNENINLSGSNSYTIGEKYFTSSSNGWWVAESIGTDDYETVRQLNVNTGTLTTGSVGITFYDDSNTMIWNGQSDWSLDGSTNVNLTLPIGIPNLVNAQSSTTLTGSLGNNTLGNTISGSSQWNWYAISHTAADAPLYTPAFPQFYFNEDKGPSVLKSANIAVNESLHNSTALPGGGIKPGLWANKYYPNYCNNEKTRFAFINTFGSFDYFNVYMPTRKVTNIDRKTYEQSSINLDDRIATYNISNRGELQYYTEYTDEFEITTDTLDSQQSQWLREMFDSSEVFIQSGSDFIPINLLNNRETIINNKARNKNYQYTIRYQFSNLREPR